MIPAKNHFFKKTFHFRSNLPSQLLVGKQFSPLGGEQCMFLGNMALFIDYLPHLHLWDVETHQWFIRPSVLNNTIHHKVERSDQHSLNCNALYEGQQVGVTVDDTIEGLR